MKRSRIQSNKARPTRGGAAVARVDAPATPLPAHRKWLFRLAALVVLPLVLLGGGEAALRLAGYGYDPHFFKPTRIGQEDFLVENDQFGLSFFPPDISRSPAPVVMRARKPPGVYRIFLLGESAALGDPRPAFGPGRYLQALLRERFPSARFEVVCVAMTAINSHALLPIARECARHQGDLWIIYMGNNEMVGPFGAVSVFGPQAPRAAFVRLGLAIQRTRLGQALVALGRRLRGRSSEESSWAGMEMFLKSQIAPEDRRKETVYQNFRENLDDILQVGLRSGAKVVLSTVAVNLKDCPPFASWPDTNLPAADRAACVQLSAEASAAEAQDRFADAAQLSERAARLDSRSAAWQFRWAEDLLRLTNATAALPHFAASRDLDALPFRADSRINALIQAAGQQPAGAHLLFCDAVGSLASASPEGIPGAESFYEHVHLNFDGNYRLARAWANEVERFLPAALTNGASADWATQDVCERRLGLTDWNRVAVIQDVIRRMHQPPFTGQSNRARRLASLQAWEQAVRQRMDTNAAARARAVYLAALKQAPDDHRLHENFAEFLEAVGDLPLATAEWQQVCDLIPQHHLAFFQVGRLSARQGRMAEAETALRRAVTLRPDLSAGWFELGRLHAAEGRFAVALADFERSRRLVPQYDRVYYEIGLVYSKLNRGAEAINSFRQALRLDPNSWEARSRLGEELAFAGQVAAARSEFEQVIRLKPDYALAHLNLGVALFKLRRVGEARQQFAEALRLDPQNQRAADYLRQLDPVKQFKR